MESRNNRKNAGKVYLFLFFLMLNTNPLHAQQIKHIGVDDGLNGRQTYNVTQDKKGFIWIATRFGVDRFDGENIKNYPMDVLYNGTKPMRTIKVTLDKDSSLWAYTDRGTIYKYHNQREEFICFSDLAQYLRAIHLDQDDNLWVGTYSDISLLENDTLRRVIDMGKRNENIKHIYTYDRNNILIVSNKNVYKYNKRNFNLKALLPTSVTEKSEFQIESCFYDPGAFKISVGSISSGLVVYDIRTKNINIVSDSRLISHPILSINKLNNKYLLLGTDGIGLCLLNQATLRIEEVYSQLGESGRQISGDAVYDIFEDKDGLFWLATFSNGISILDFAEQGFKSIRHESNNDNSLSRDIVCDILEDSDSNLWFATNNSLSRWNKEKNKWSTFLQSKNVLVLHEDSKQNIWVGTYSSGVYLINKDGRVLRNYIKNTDSSQNTIGTNFVYTIFEDGDGNMWFGGKKGNVSKLDVKTNTFYQIPVYQANYISSKGKDTILISNESGVYEVSVNSLTVSNSPINGKLRSTFVTDILVQSDSVIWLGTYGDGINKYNPLTGQIRYFTPNEGLPSNTVYAFLQDDDNNLWFSSENGIGKLNTVTYEVTTFSLADGISGNRYRQLSKGKGRDGTLYFGSYDGVTYFNPREVKKKRSHAKLFMQDFRLFNRTVKPGDDNSPLYEALDNTSEIKLNYKQHSFSIYFSAIDFSLGSNGRYTWILEGLDKEWTMPTKEHIANYTNINPGEYIFQVKYLDDNNNIIDTRRLSITVSPPFWDTIWARAIFILLLTGIGYLIYTYVKQRIKKRQSEENIKFFINTAHDIRTPLTLISSPIYELKESIPTTGKTDYLMDLVTENLDKLNKMFSQLLDFQKASEYKTQLVVKERNVNKYLTKKHRYWKQAADKKNISLSLHLPSDEINEWFDIEKMDKILDNLLSNAIKYTHRNGNVAIKLANDDNTWEITISDDGIGISKEDLRNLFHRFYRASNAINSQITGSGLGLMLIKKYVESHKGQITVSSIQNKGTEFKIRFTHGDKHYQDNVIIDNNDIPISEQNPNDEQENIDKLKIRLLVVEDNHDLRSYLRLSLNHYYNVFVAENGSEAWDNIRKINPDIIVSDLQMPHMDGFELSRKIKTTFETSHIPVILLTVVNDKINVETGFGIGIDDYIEKPFDLKYLRIKIDNIIQNRKMLRLKYLGIEKNGEQENKIINDLNAEFIDRATTIINENIEDRDFSVSDLSKAMGLSRSLLYNKFNATTGYTPNEFIKIMKMNKAISYFREKKYTINEVALMVGFDEPAYFSTCFKRIYGKTPKQFIEENID